MEKMREKSRNTELIDTQHAGTCTNLEYIIQELVRAHRHAQIHSHTINTTGRANGHMPSYRVLNGRQTGRQRGEEERRWDAAKRKIELFTFPSIIQGVYYLLYLCCASAILFIMAKIQFAHSRGIMIDHGLDFSFPG